MAETFTWVPSYSTSLNVKPRVLSADFGDGYSQKAADGINNSPERWTVKFQDRPISEIENILSFLVNRKGYEWFWWTPPGGSAKKYTCGDWTKSYDYYESTGLTATFDQSFTNEIT